MNAFQAAALEVALTKMFNTSPHFCIIDFDNMASVAGVRVSQQERDTLRLMHCVNYHDMPKGMKESLATQVFSILRRAPEWKIEVKVAFQTPAQILIQ